LALGTPSATGEITIKTVAEPHKRRTAQVIRVETVASAYLPESLPETGSPKGICAT